MAQRKNTRLWEAYYTLKNQGIITTADLDAYIKAHPKKDRLDRPYLMSRYDALVELVGGWAADNLLQEMSVQQCFWGKG